MPLSHTVAIPFKTLRKYPLRMSNRALPLEVALIRHWDDLSPLVRVSVQWLRDLIEILCKQQERRNVCKERPERWFYLVAKEKPVVRGGGWWGGISPQNR